MPNAEDMHALRRRVRRALEDRFGPEVGDFVVLETADGEQPFLSYRFVLYGYWPVVFTFDRGAWGFGVDHGNVATPLISSWTSTFTLGDTGGLLAELDRAIRLMIPDKYLAVRDVVAP